MIFASSRGMGSVFEGTETVPFEKKETPFEAKRKKGNRGLHRGWRAFRNVKTLDTQANVIVAGGMSPAAMTAIQNRPVLVGQRFQMRNQNRVRRYNHDADFVPADSVNFKADDYGDIRPMGPLELPDYTERRPSALGWLGQTDAATAAAAAAAAKTADQPWYASIATALAPIIKTGAEVYQQVKELRAKPKAATTQIKYIDSGSGQQSTGLKPWHWVAIIGGGVVILGGTAIWLLNRK